MEDAGVTALQWDDKIYQAAGLSPVPLLQSPVLTRIMQRNYEATAGEWRNFTRTTANEAQRIFNHKWTTLIIWLFPGLYRTQRRSETL